MHAYTNGNASYAFYLFLLLLACCIVVTIALCVKYRGKIGAIKCKDNVEKKILLQLIIEKITIDRIRSIDIIQLHLNDNLIRFLQASQEGISKADMPSIFVRIMKWYREVDIMLCIWKETGWLTTIWCKWGCLFWAICEAITVYIYRYFIH